MSYSPLVEPEGIAIVFVEARARRDADKLASLFDEDAEFVNVTRLWWHDREAIRKAHAHGFEHIFGASTLRLMIVRVKILVENIAVVHARGALRGKVVRRRFIDQGVRNTILSFVVHRRAGMWSCASAHNTDIVPHMETNLVEDDGSFRSVSYRD